MPTEFITLPTADELHHHTGLVTYTYNLQPQIAFHVIAGGPPKEPGQHYLRSAQQELGGVLAFGDEQPFVRGHTHLRQSNLLDGLEHHWCSVFDSETFAFRAVNLAPVLQRLRAFDWLSLT